MQLECCKPKPESVQVLIRFELSSQWANVRCQQGTMSMPQFISLIYKKKVAILKSPRGKSFQSIKETKLMNLIQWKLQQKSKANEKFRLQISMCYGYGLGQTSDGSIRNSDEDVTKRTIISHSKAIVWIRMNATVNFDDMLTFVHFYRNKI